MANGIASILNETDYLCCDFVIQNTCTAYSESGSAVLQYPSFREGNIHTRQGYRYLLVT